MFFAKSSGLVATEALRDRVSPKVLLLAILVRRSLWSGEGSAVGRRFRRWSGEGSVLLPPVAVPMARLAMDSEEIATVANARGLGLVPGLGPGLRLGPLGWGEECSDGGSSTEVEL